MYHLEGTAITSDQLFYQMRARIGNPDKKQVPDRMLADFMTDALDWMADQLKFQVKTDSTSLLLVAEQQEYLIPEDVAWFVWLEWDTNRITPATTQKWDRDGTDWRNAAPGQPLQYAIQGRNLVLYPLPDAATVTTQPYLTFRYIAAAAPLTAAGPLGLGELENWIAVYKAAVLWLIAHPSDTAAALIQGYQEELVERVPRAKRRLANPIRDYRARLHVDTTGRWGPAR